MSTATISAVCQCLRCGSRFIRQSSRGRQPLLCPSCRNSYPISHLLPAQHNPVRKRHHFDRFLRTTLVPGIYRGDVAESYSIWAESAELTVEPYLAPRKLESDALTWLRIRGLSPNRWTFESDPVRLHTLAAQPLTEADRIREYPLESWAADILTPAPADDRLYPTIREAHDNFREWEARRGGASDVRLTEIRRLFEGLGVDRHVRVSDTAYYAIGLRDPKTFGGALHTEGVS